MSGAPDVQGRAVALVDDLAAAARLIYQPADSEKPASFNFELGRGGDRWRCRAIIGQAKADAALWHACVAEVGRRCAGGADA